VKIPLRTVQKEHTGLTVRKNKLNIFGRNVNLYLSGRTPMEKYDRIRSAENLTMFGRIILPMKILSTEYIEFEEREVMLSEEEAEQIAFAKINQIIAEKFDNDENIIEITGKSYAGEIYDGYYYLICVVDCIENIAKEMPLSANSEDSKNLENLENVKTES
jgi:hypothetical protein